MDAILLMVEGTSQPAVALDMTSKHTSEHMRSASMVHTAYSQEVRSRSSVQNRFELKKARGVVCAL